MFVLCSETDTTPSNHDGEARTEQAPYAQRQEHDGKSSTHSSASEATLDTCVKHYIYILFMCTTKLSAITNGAKLVDSIFLLMVQRYAT